MMLAAGSDVNETAPDGNTALLIAAHSGHGMLAQWLLNQGADANAAGPGYTALHVAVLEGDRTLLSALLDHKANPNARLTNGAPLRRTDPDGLLTAEFTGATSFWLAARFVEPEMMQTLARNGADPKIATTDGITPLMAAAGVGWDTGYDRRGPYITGAGLPTDEDQALAAVRLAIQLGGNVRAADEARDTALHAAVAKGYGRIVRLLAESGAALSAKNKKGDTPLAIARRASDSSASQKAIADLLVKLGAK
jgi:ankyrin repeat protein